MIDLDPEQLEEIKGILSEYVPEIEDEESFDGEREGSSAKSHKYPTRVPVD